MFSCSSFRILFSSLAKLTISLEGLAMVYYEQGKYELAEPLQQQVLWIREQARDLEHPEVALSLNRLGNIHYEQGKYELAEWAYQRVLQIREQTGGPEHFRLASPLNNLGNLSREQGKYELAEPLCQRAVHLAEKTLGPKHPDLAVMLGSLADLYREWGNYTQAEILYQRALALSEQALGLEHHAVAYHLHGLALLYREQGQYKQARALFQRTVQIRKQRLDRDHPETAQTLHDQALLHMLQGKMSEAHSLAERAFQIRLPFLRETHPKTVASRTLAAQLEEARRIMQDGLAKPYRTRGQVELTEPLLQEAGTTFKRYPVQSHPETVKSRQNYRCLLEQRESIIETTIEGHLKGSTSVLEQSTEKDSHWRARSKEGEVPTGSETHPLQEFVEACCELHPRAWSQSSDLWQAYECWVAERQECFPLSRRAFTTQLNALGCRADRTSSARIWRGISLVNNHI